MTTLKIKRKDESFYSLIDYGVYIDDKKMGSLSNNKTREFAIAPGQHVIVLKTGKASSPQLSFNTNDGECKVFNAGGPLKVNTIMVTGAVLNMTAILLVGFTHSYLFYLLSVFSIMLSAYGYITAKKRSLYLKETM